MDGQISAIALLPQGKKLSVRSLGTAAANSKFEVSFYEGDSAHHSFLIYFFKKIRSDSGSFK